jgi:hypothetical protein
MWEAELNDSFNISVLSARVISLGKNPGASARWFVSKLANVFLG